MTTNPMGMIEAVARAICAADGHEWPSTDGYNDRSQKRHFLKTARAAIEAMRKPTPEMSVAVYSAELNIYWNYAADGRPGTFEDAFGIAIDAALSEPSP